MDSRSASGDMKFTIDLETLDSIIGDGSLLQVKDTAPRALQNTGLATKVILEELAKYPHTDQMIDTLDFVGPPVSR